MDYHSHSFILVSEGLEMMESYIWVMNYLWLIPVITFWVLVIAYFITRYKQLADKK